MIPEFMYKPLKELPFVVLDLETTGFKPNAAGITEVAIISINDGQEEPFETLVNPEYPIPAKITDLTGITEDMVSDKPVIKEVLPIIDALFQNCIFVAHNVPFDWSFIDFNYRMHLKKPLKMPSLCTLRLARKFLGLRSNKLENVAKHYGVSLVDAHRAMNDTEAVKHILYHMLDDLDKRGIKTGADLYKNNLIFPECPPVR
ncbi:MAG: 3'-5' exonuclease [Candidatus Rifleibacteriota bacterium]